MLFMYICWPETGYGKHGILLGFTNKDNKYVWDDGTEIDDLTNNNWFDSKYNIILY